MKRILLICSLLLSTTYTVTYAQSGRPVPVSKSVFMAKADEIDKDLTAGKLPDAKTAYAQIDVMMDTKVRENKYLIQDAVIAKNTAIIPGIQADMKTQWDIRNSNSDLANDLTKNQSAVRVKLLQFATYLK